MVRLVCHGLTIFSGIAFFRCGCISHGSACFLFSSLGFSHAHIRTTSKHSRTANAGIYLLTKKKRSGSLRHLEPTKSSNVSGNAVGFMTSTTDFVCSKIMPSYKQIEHLLLVRSRFYVSTLVTPASPSQVAQYNTIESCTS